MYDSYLTQALASVITAMQALSAFSDTQIKGLKNTAAYHTQQASEFIIKHQIYNQPAYNKGREEDDIPQVYGHDIDRLIYKYCDKYEIEVPKKIRDNAERISEWEAESRYNLAFSVRVDSMKSILEAESRWLCNIKPEYSETIKRVREKYHF